MPTLLHVRDKIFTLQQNESEAFRLAEQWMTTPALVSPFKEYPFQIGELYLFHTSNPACPSEESLWGVFDKRAADTIYLESSSENLLTFTLRSALPPRYHYVRLSSRSELRDYFVDITYYQYASR